MNAAAWGALLPLAVVWAAAGCQPERARPGAPVAGADTTVSAEADSAMDGFIRGSVEVGGRTYPYAVHLPPGYDPARRWPAILFLHGSGERGDDGVLQTRVGLGAVLRSDPARYPAVVILPQAPEESTWHGDAGTAALSALDAAMAAYGVDEDRVYLTGMSLGGNGSWHLAARSPDRWAALAPVCPWVVWRGWGELYPGDAEPFERLAREVAGIPTWIWHGAADPLVPVEESRRMAAALEAAGADVRYTELEGVGHNAWDPAYGSAELAEWLLSQRRR